LSKIAVAHEKRRSVKRFHDDDEARREFFAGLVEADKENVQTAVNLMKIANKHYEAQKRPKLTERTAQRWKKDCLADKELFTAGPLYSRDGNRRLSDAEVRLRSCAASLYIFDVLIRYRKSEIAQRRTEPKASVVFQLVWKRKTSKLVNHGSTT